MDGPTGCTCDRCGPTVRARVVYLTETDELDFCGHCSARNHDALTARGFDAYELALSDVRSVAASSLTRG